MKAFTILLFVGLVLTLGCSKEKTTEPDTYVAPVAPSRLTVSLTLPLQARLTWQDESEIETGFEIERRVGQNGVFNLLLSIQTGFEGKETHTLIDSDLVQMTTYSYRMRAVNRSTKSEYSNTATVTTPDLFAPPSDLAAHQFQEKSVILSWQDNSYIETKFEIERRDSSSNYQIVGMVNPVDGTGERSFEDTTILPVKSYYYRVRAENDNNDVRLSNELMVVTVFYAPTALTCELAQGEHMGVTLRWQDNSQIEDGFELIRKSGLGAYQYLATLPGAEGSGMRSYIDENVNFLTIYDYRLRATQDETNSDWSNASSIDTPLPERSFPLGNTGQSIIMVWMPAGSFRMGWSDWEEFWLRVEGPAHSVTFADGFWIGKYEVTQGQWQAVMGFNPSSGYGEGDNYPVYNVSWEAIQDFEQHLSEQFRLPTEAEWEYACRAGTTTRFYWGEDRNLDQVGEYSWYIGNSGHLTHPIGTKAPNAWGLYDMSGNLWECCEDWYHETYEGAPSDGSAWLTPEGTSKVWRGDSWWGQSGRSALRTYAPSGMIAGFRLASSTLPHP